MKFSGHDVNFGAIIRRIQVLDKVESMRLKKSEQMFEQMFANFRNKCAIVFHRQLNNALME
jgi:hypothetical protein